MRRLLALSSCLSLLAAACDLGAGGPPAPPAPATGALALEGDAVARAAASLAATVAAADDALTALGVGDDARRGLLWTLPTEIAVHGGVVARPAASPRRATLADVLGAAEALAAAAPSAVAGGEPAALDAVAAATRRVTLLALAVAQAPPLPAEDALALDGPGVRAALSALAYDVGTLACAIRHARDPRSPRDDEAVTASCALGADAGAASAIPAIADDAPRVVLARGAAARADSARIGAALDVIVTVDRARAREALRAALVAAGGALAEEQAAFDAALATAARRYRDTLSGGGWAVDLDAAAALATYAADDDDLDAVLAALTRWAEPAADAPAACRGLAPLDCVRSAFAAASPPRAERLDALEDALAVYAAALPRGCAPGDLACARIIGAVDTIGGELGDLQDLALQDALSHADRDLTTLANMMKARRDSAENAVDNLK